MGTKEIEQPAGGGLPANVPNPGYQDASKMVYNPNPANTGTIKNPKYAEIEARIAGLKKALDEMDVKLNDRTLQPTPEVNASARIELKTQLDDAIAELAQTPAQIPIPAYDPANDSFARHYQAMGDAMKRGAPPETLGGKPVSKPTPKVEKVVEKLKEESKKGGANFWDVIEAASAGWGGRKSAYAEKKMREAEAQTEMDRLVKATELQSKAAASAGTNEFNNQMKLLEKADALKKASIGLSGIPGVSPAGQAFSSTFLGGNP